MSKNNPIHFKNVDEVNLGYQNTSGWFKKLQSSDSPSNKDKDKHPILRVKNVDDINDIAGAIRFQEEREVFQGCLGNNRWTDFNVSSGADGLDGLNYKTIVEGNNLFNSGDNYFPLFKNIVKSSELDSSQGVGENDDSQITETIHRLPTFKYDSQFSSKQFNLSNHNIIFEPYDNTSYKVIVRENSSWPPVDYTQHSRFSILNNGFLLNSNGYFLHNLPKSFQFYNQGYDVVYVNENGYITLGSGESAFLQNLLQNHFSKTRISALFSNLEPSQNENNNSEIFIGNGRYGEKVFTFQEYYINTQEGNIRVDFQIRLFLNDQLSDNLYSDDYYKNGTIQISYNFNSNYDNISPLVGLSDGRGYNPENFTELYFSNLKNNSQWVEESGSGIPFLRTFLTLSLSRNDSTSITNLKAKYPSTDLSINKNEPMTGDEYKYKLILDDLNLSDLSIDNSVYESSFVENNKYVKVINLGNVKVNNFTMAIRSIYDYEPKKNLSITHYSDVTNYFIDNSGLNPFIDNRNLENEWLTIADSNFVDISQVFTDNYERSKDFINIYDNLESNSGYQDSIYNSKIYRIQVRYENRMKDDFTFEKNLLIKVIYILKSDEITQSNNNISNAVPLNYTRLTGGNNYGPYNYQTNGVNVFSIIRTGLNLQANFSVQIYDYLMTTTQEQTNNIQDDEQLRETVISYRSDINRSLTLELLDSSGNLIGRSLPNDNKTTGRVNFQSIKLFNSITKQTPGNEQYYIRITGTHKLGYYGISLQEPDTQSSASQISAIYTNYKLTKISDLPLTIEDTDLDSTEQVYCQTTPNNIFLLTSDIGNGKMVINNFDFTGQLKNNYPVNTNYDNDTNIFDILLLSNDKFIITSQPESDLNFDLYNPTYISTLTYNQSIPIRDYFFMKEIVENDTNYILSFFLTSSSLRLVLIAASDTDSSFTTSNINGITDTQDINPIITQILNVIIYDKDNIFIIGNNTNDGSSKIIKFSFDESSKQYTHGGTLTINDDGNLVNKIFYADKYDYNGEQYIILLVGSGINGDNGWKIITVPLNLNSSQVTFKNLKLEENNLYPSQSVFPLTSSSGIKVDILNFKIKRNRLLVLFETTSNNNRYFISYEVSVSEFPIELVKRGGPYTENQFLSEVDIHNISINGNNENVYVILSKNTNASAINGIKMRVTIQKEIDNTNLVEVLSGIEYLNDLDMGNGSKSIFNIYEDRRFDFTKNMLKLFKNPVPLDGTTNDELFFFLGFTLTNGIKNLVIEGYGKLTNVDTNTGEIISSNNKFQTLTDKLQFSDISNNNIVTDHTSNPINFSNEYPYNGRFEYNVLGESYGNSIIENNSREGQQRIWSSMKTIKISNNYYTVVMYGPTVIQQEVSENKISLNTHMTFQVNIYKENSYISLNSSNFQTIFTQYFITNSGYAENNLTEIFPIENGFIFFGLTRISGVIRLVVKKATLNGSDWSIETQDLTSALGNFNSYFSEYFNSFFHCDKIGNDNIVIKLNPEKPENTYGDRGCFFIFVDIETLNFSSSSDSKKNINFSNKIHSSITTGNQDSLGNSSIYSAFVFYNNNNSGNSPTLTNLYGPILYFSLPNILFNRVSFINAEFNSTEYLYLIRGIAEQDQEYTYNNNIYKIPFNITRCEKGDSLNENVSEDYFETVESAFVNILQVNDLTGSVLSSGLGMPTGIIFDKIFSKNLYFVDNLNSKIFVYFLCSVKPEYIKKDGSYLILNKTSNEEYGNIYKYNVNNQDFTVFFNTFRLFKLEINFNIDFNIETHTVTKAYNFEDVEITTNNIDEVAPTKEKETIILSGDGSDYEYPHIFDIITDNSNKYIIIGSFTRFSFDQSGFLSHKTTERNKLDFKIYKVNDDGSTDFLAYGEEQNILAINIENDNLVIFSNTDTSSVFEQNGEILKVFKKPISDVSEGSQIIMGTTIFTTTEPVTDLENTLKFPDYFLNTENGSNFVYNGASSRRISDRNQDNGLLYNMTVLNSYDNVNNNYGDEKSLSVISFGNFDEIVAPSDSDQTSNENETTNEVTNTTNITSKVNYFLSQNGNSERSNFVVGRNRNTSFLPSENDSGTIFYSYSNSLELNDISNFYVRTNSIPNYKPIYSAKEIKGSWNNELRETSTEYYSIAPQNYGWLNSDLTENGSYFKIPQNPKTLNPKSVFVGSKLVTENFWFIGDINWDSIMVNPGYSESYVVEDDPINGYYVTNPNLSNDSVNDKLLTPVGRIGVASNGVVFYNYSNLERNKNAVKELKGDVFGGQSDSNHNYHYHQWPINLEGMLNLGHPNNSIQVRQTPVLDGNDLYDINSFPKLIRGRSYYFNQIDISNYDKTEVDKYNLKFEPIRKGNTYRYAVKMENDEFLLSEIDFAGNPIGGQHLWVRRMVLSKIKQGDTIIFHQDNITNTKSLIITSDFSNPDENNSLYPLWNPIDEINRNLSEVKNSTLSIIGTPGNNGSKTIFNVPYDFDVKFLRYQPYYLDNAKILDETNFNASSDTITLQNHGYKDNETIILKIDSGSITNLQNGKYKIEFINNNQFKLIQGNSSINFSNVTPGNYKLFSISTILTRNNISQNQINLDDHGLETGDAVIFESPSGTIQNFNQNQAYYVIRISSNSFKLANSLEDALNNNFRSLVSTSNSDIYFKLESKNNIDRGSFIISGNFYDYTVTINGADTNEPYFSLTAYGQMEQLGDGNSSPSLTNIKYGDLIFFNQTNNDPDYKLYIKTDNVAGSTNLDLDNFSNYVGNLETDIPSGLYFAPFNTIGITNTSLYYNLGESITDKTIIGGEIKLSEYERPDKFTFENSLVKQGSPGNSYCPYTTFTVPVGDIKTNFLTLKYNTLTLRYEFYGELENNNYIQNSSNLLSEIKLFKDTRYVIILDTSIDSSNNKPRFSPTNTTYSVYSFEYESEDSINYGNNKITFMVGEIIPNIFLYNFEQPTDLLIGSTYNNKIFGEINYEKVDKVRITSLGRDVSNDPGSDFNVRHIVENTIKVTIVNNRFVLSGNYSEHNYYDPEGTFLNLDNIKLFNGEKYKFIYEGFTDKELKFSTSSSDFVSNNIDFDGSYDNSYDNMITFTVNGIDNLTDLYIYDGNNTSDLQIGENYNNQIKNENVKPLNTFVDVNANKFRFFKTPAALQFFTGYLDYESGQDYISYKLIRTGPDGHSPLLGYAFDGYPIYGPLGYNIESNVYNDSATTIEEQSNFTVKLMKSSYTGGIDSEGNPIYVQGSGDLDICNGIFSKTPEFPEGIFHYVCTIELNINRELKLSSNSNYGYLNNTLDIINPAYPYVIGAYKGLPEKTNFNTSEISTTSNTSEVDQITTYTINFKTLRTVNNKFNGIEFPSIQIGQDENYLNLRPNPHPYVWNFTNSLDDDSFFGKDNSLYTNNIDTLRSSSTDIKFKAYGTIKKFKSKGVISKGLAVRLVNNTRIENGVIIKTLEIELYDSTNILSEEQQGAAFLGVALNDSNDGENCYVCTQGITTIKIGNSLGRLNCGSYGILALSSESGYIIGLGPNQSVSNNIPVAGYFVEDVDSITINNLVLFYVKGNFEFA